MKPRLLVPLLLCVLLLAGCYRQTEETFQQVDSAVVVSDATPTSLQDIIVVSEDETGIETRQPYITPETVPGQVEQPTVIPATSAAVIAVTAPPIGSTPLATSIPTQVLPVELDPDSPCVHTVQGGDSIFRLSLNWETTMDEVAALNDLDDVDVLSLGQLLQIPGCVFLTPTPEPSPEPTMPPTVTSIPAPLVSDSGPPFHVVSAGETLESISLRYRVDVNAIIELNDLTNPDQLSVGQELLLPG
ncbi:MAG: LysM peptidoglycan-binding domain-containing protein [Chloroflexi bacterium]|nr:LysM peptidoglycan-binding domain-containing protein [Chloroflexota bacterium]